MIRTVARPVDAALEPTQHAGRLMRILTFCRLGALAALVSGGVACGSTGATSAASNGTGSGGATTTATSTSASAGSTTPGAGGAASTSTTASTGAASSTTSTGSTSTGSTSATGASGSTTTSSSGGSTPLCKRGIASNTAPGAAFSPALAWQYNWSLQGTGPGVGIPFVPMVWGSGSLGKAIPAGSAFLLGFNEPNFQSQSNLTPQQAAADWPMIEAQAATTGAAIVSPALNYCGPASQCNGTDPYQYLKDFFAACPGCKVDYVAVHWYNCDLPSLQAYIDGGTTLEGFVQFGKPIWLTEFSCDGTATVAQQQAYMEAAVPYLESDPHVFRYSWFSATPIPNAQLLNPDGSPTALGQVYIDLPQSCH